MEQLLNEVTPTWQKETSLPEALTGAGCVAYNEKIYMFGASNSTYVKVWIFDCKSSTWTAGASMPKGLYGCTAVVIDGKAYVFGQDTGNTCRVQIYNINENTWLTGTTLSKRFFNYAAVPVGSKVYVLGGQENMDTHIYDTIQDTWEIGIPLPGSWLQDRVGLKAVILNSKIYVMGGGMSTGKGNPILKETDVFDVNRAEWNSGYPMPYPAKLFGSVAVGNKIYIAGGESDSSALSCLDKAAVYDAQKKKWSMLPYLKERVQSPAVTHVGNKLYVIGGLSNSTGSTVATSSVYSLEIDTSGDTPLDPESLSVLLNTSEQVQLSVSQDLADNTELTWSSSVDSVATVDANGKVTALAEGLTYINAKNTDETFNESIPVRVFPGTADETRLAVHLTVGQKQKLYLADDPSTVTWEAVDESIATVDAVGKVTAVSKGLAIVKGWIAGKEYQIYVRVSE